MWTNFTWQERDLAVYESEASLAVVTPPQQFITVCAISLLYRSAEARAHGSLGCVYEQLKDTDKAIDHLEQVCMWQPHHLS